MQRILAIAFDLFNTLVTVESGALGIADTLLYESLRENGFSLQEKEFKNTYREEAVRFIEESRISEVETHNRFWIHSALGRHGYDLDPFDPRIAAAVEAYFSGFCPRTHLIPGTKDLLSKLGATYRLGLLSNFTHGPAARKILSQTGLDSFFHVALISGELGYRKPSLLVFQRLLEELGVSAEHTLYIGDDPQPDVYGAWRAGIQPVWTTYVIDHNISFAPGVLGREAGVPHMEVPRISSWEDFNVFLMQHA